MKDSEKTKEQLIREIEEMRKRLGEQESMLVETTRALEELKDSEEERKNTVLNGAPFGENRTGTLIDIPDRKQIEEALRESEDLYKTLVTTLPDAVTASDLEGKITFASERTAKLHGYERPDELIGKSSFEIIAAEDHTRAAENLRKTLELRFTGPAEYTLLRKDGTRFLGELHAALLKDAHGRPKGFIATVRDITEKRKTEEELFKVQKLESIGILAGGIAHDFNNILTAILGNITVAKMDARPGSDLYQFLGDAERAALQARDLTRQLLTFSKGGEPIKKTISLANLVKKTTQFALRGSNVRCEFSFPRDLLAVEADEEQMSQVIHNLVINGAQAMPDGGVLKVSAENIPAGALDFLPVKDKPYVKISIADTGIGIPEEHLAKIFDPYFTTKKNGTGLGLTISYSVVKSHNGSLCVDSAFGMGTKVTIYLPASLEQPSMEEGEEKPIAVYNRVLLMEDDELVQKAVCMMLLRLGYRVEFARDGHEALLLYQLAKESGDPFHAVIMDLTVPGGMGGKDTISKLRQIDPDVKAIVSSGYSNDPIMADFEKYGFRAVLPKPFQIEQLSDALRVLLK
jgi:PAS domain S-box-containing protein